MAQSKTTKKTTTKKVDTKKKTIIKKITPEKPSTNIEAKVQNNIDKNLKIETPANIKKVLQERSESFFITSSRNLLIKSNNSFVNFITINLDNKNLHETFSDIYSQSKTDLEDLLKNSLNYLFKNYVTSARESKALIETKYLEFTNELERKYVKFKRDKLSNLNKKSKTLTNRLKQIEKTIDFHKDEIDSLNEKLLKNFNEFSDNRATLKLENKTPLLKEDEAKNNEDDSNNDTFVKNLSEYDVHFGSNKSKIKFRIKEINEDIESLKSEKLSIIEKINKNQLSYTATIDGAFTKKQNEIVKLEIDKIEAYIWIRNNLIHINRIIRDVRVQIGLHKIDEKRTEFYESMESILDVIDNIQEEFELFDSVGKVKNSIASLESINTDTRIINLKTGDSL